MNVTTITMDPAEAQVKLDAYRDALERRHSADVDAEWKAAADAYQELAKGTPLIDPVAAIRECGWRADSRPVLAIARADMARVQWEVTRSARWFDPDTRQYKGSWAPMEWRFSALRKKDTRWGRRDAAGKTFYIKNVITEPPGEPKSGVAMVPMVPPDVLPARGCDLSKHFILWEVESWDAAPPIDPILLRPIGGDLYAVVAQWDLTDIERAIIAGTREGINRPNWPIYKLRSATKCSNLQHRGGRGRNKSCA